MNTTPNSSFGMEGLPPMIGKDISSTVSSEKTVAMTRTGSDVKNDGKKKYTPTKAYQTEQKQKQKQSIVLRILVFMRLLMCNCKYSFVISRNRRASFKTLTYFPVEKMYNEEGQLLFDSDTIVMTNRNMKLKHCQKVICEQMIGELEKHGYVFGKIQTRKAKMVIEGNTPVTLTKITSVENKSCGVRVPMAKMETTIGMDGYDACQQTFEKNTHVEKLVIGNTESIEQIFTSLVEKRVIEEGKSLYVCEGYEEMLEQVYWRQWTMSLSLPARAPVVNNQMNQPTHPTNSIYDDSDLSAIQVINQFNQMHSMQQPQTTTVFNASSPSSENWVEYQQQYQMTVNPQFTSDDSYNTSSINFIDMYQDTFINNYQ